MEKKHEAIEVDPSFKKGVTKPNKKLSSYDTSRSETNTPQKIRQGNEPEAIEQRLRKIEGN